MKRFLNVALLAVATALAACQPAPVRTATAPSPPAGMAIGATHYQCEDGSAISATYPDADSAQVVYQGQAIDMHLVVSADGARYAGGGWQWWTKGLAQGYWSPLAADEDVAAAPGVACTAQ